MNLVLISVACVCSGKLGRTEELAPYDLAMKLIDVYVGYPLGKGLFPLNYCALEPFLPSSLNSVLQWVC